VHPPAPKNVLFLWTDQQRPDTIGAYGNPAIRTPHLDRLAASGALFAHAYCAQPICSPSRASVLTGVYPHTHGVIENNVPLPPTPLTLAELLRPAGYVCGYVGKWHLGREHAAQRGFEDFWSSTEDYGHGYAAGDPSAQSLSTYQQWLMRAGAIPPERVTPLSRPEAAALPEAFGKPAFQAAECVRFLETHRDRPFLLMCNFLEPHPPVTGPRDGAYAPEDMVLPPSWYREMDETVPLRYRQQRDVERNDAHYRWLRRNDEWGWKELKARYWGLCTQVDHYAGVILDRLEALGLAERTIVVYSSDHGDMMGEHRLLNKAVQYEGAVRVPLIVRVPGHAPRRVTTPVSQVSLVPTLIEALGGEAPRHVQARSLLPLLAGDGAGDEDLVIEWNGSPGRLPVPAETQASVAGDPRPRPFDARTIRRGRWKLNVYLSGEHELYDLQDDPGELHNLAHDAALRPVIETLCDRLRGWQAATCDPLRLPDVLRDLQTRARDARAARVAPE
jgi:arylsulfatase A-like enzyme